MASNYQTNGEPPINFPGQQVPLQLGPVIKWGVPVIVLILLFAFLSFARSVYTDWLWYDQFGYRSVFVKVLTTRIWLFFASAAIFGVVLGVSLYFANRLSRGEITLPLPPETTVLLRRLILWGSVMAVVLLSVIFGSIAAGRWEIFLKLFNSVPFGETDPLYNKDLSFYVFTLPVFKFLQGWLLGAAILTMLGTLGLYFVNFSLRGIQFNLTSGLKIHISIIAAIIMFVFAWGHWLDRWELVLSGQGAVFGAAYADIHARRPALLILTIIAGASGVLMLVNVYISGLRLLIGAAALWIVMAIALASIWPALMQQFTVNPNEFVREAPYIERNIDFTRRGFALNRIEEGFYPTDTAVTRELIQNNLQTINNIRLWDPRPLSDVYKQIQLIRPYYDFKDADVDRYVIDGRNRQVLLSPREVAPEKLEPESQTWVNTKLFYTHGIGVSMSPVTEFTPEGRPEFFAKDIPVDGVLPIQSQDSDGEPEILVSNPRLYYGENTTAYVIVKTNTDELDFQTGEGDLVRTKYDGNGGVQLSSFLKRVAYAWQFADVNILISGEITGESLIQYRRQVQERISTIVPFLQLDADPYVVATNDVLFWIQDAYTVSDHYPYSDPFEDTSTFNYMRNSVKATVNAFDGTVRFYVWDDTDPIIQTYSKIFPNVFLSRDQMPQALQGHVRYPQDFFSIQTQKNMKYHMRDPQNFYNNEDLWAIPNEKFGQSDNTQPVEPYYVIMKLPGETQEEFVLLFPYTPNQRQNLIGWLAARSDGDNYGKLVAFNFPKDRQVDGPEQVEARIDNDQDISAWFTLRCTEGAACIRGNLLVIPIGNSLLYAEPVYIQAEGVRFPELKRVILATGDKVVMEDSLSEALEALTGFESVAGARPTGDGTSGTRGTAPGNVQTEIESFGDAIEALKENLSILEDALERLIELTGGE